MIKNFFCFRKFGWLAGLALLAGCGDGDFRVNHSAGVVSTVDDDGVNVTPPSGTTAQAYFTQTIYPILIANTGNKGCTNSACHGAPQPEEGFFQVDASSAANSYNWARVRRTTISFGQYANSNALLLKTRKDQEHQNFQFWTSSEKATIDTWLTLPD